MKLAAEMRLLPLKSGAATLVIARAIRLPRYGWN
jgi:hypothetical protein